jgi:Asp-tRNAAsn/Glu-tRNAGln amidotransferase A subunit and related amidases
VSELHRLPAIDLQGLLESGQVSAREVTDSFLQRIEQVDGALNSFLHVNQAATEVADAIDRKRSAGEALPPTAGLPVAEKDVLCTSDMPTTSGSRILKGWVPPYDATVVRKYRDAGMVALGKTNMDEFAMGSSTEHSGYGPTNNPWDLERVPGGSGGGSAAAVSAFEAPVGPRKRHRRVYPPTGGAHRNLLV